MRPGTPMTDRATLTEDTATPARSVDPSVLNGVIPILVTAFTDEGLVDLNQMDRQIEFLVGADVSWAGFGFGSEVTRLAQAEMLTMVGHVVRTAAGRLRIFGNAEMTSVSSGIEQVGRVRDTGAELALVRLSALAGILQEALFETFAAVAEGGGVPIIVQDAPQSTGVDLAATTLARLLLEVPAVAAVKVEPIAAAAKISAIVEALNGAPGVIIGGSGGVDYLHELDRGACGTMPGPAYPELFAALGRLHQGGKRAEAIGVLARVLPLIELGQRDMDTFLFVQKYVPRRRGVLSTTGLAARTGGSTRDLQRRSTNWSTSSLCSACLTNAGTSDGERGRAGRRRRSGQQDCRRPPLLPAAIERTERARPHNSRRRLGAGHRCCRSPASGGATRYRKTDSC